jgi:DNA-binding NarL/FixJ family response regulator
MRRLYKNTYTREGQRLTVKGWTVKIQHNGKRKTFSLKALSKKLAAMEAWRICQTIRTDGWGALAPVASVSGSERYEIRPEAQNPKPLDYWKRKLVKRPYPALSSEQEREFAIHIEHAGAGHYFPLETNLEQEAANKAAQIYDVVSRLGWSVAHQTFHRELSLALRWLDNPVAWTYTTIHTWKTAAGASEKRGSDAGGFKVALVEPDAGLRVALASHLGSQEGVWCRHAFSSLDELVPAICREPVDLVLLNSCFREAPGGARFAKGCNLVTIGEKRSSPQAAKRGEVVDLFYSVFEDADQLFKCTPGGAHGYLLKRTPLDRLLAPMAAATGPLTQRLALLKVRQYFQEVLFTMPLGPSNERLVKLTPREREILSRLAKGQVTKEIAGALGISGWTVNGHVKSILEKLEVHTRTEAVVRYLEPAC